MGTAGLPKQPIPSSNSCCWVPHLDWPSLPLSLVIKWICMQQPSQEQPTPYPGSYGCQRVLRLGSSQCACWDSPNTCQPVIQTCLPWPSPRFSFHVHQWDFPKSPYQASSQALVSLMAIGARLLRSIVHPQFQPLYVFLGVATQPNWSQNNSLVSQQML